jgi:hypothetical protein
MKAIRNATPKWYPRHSARPQGGSATTRLLNSAQDSRMAIAAITIATMPSTTAAVNQFVRTRRV